MPKFQLYLFVAVVFMSFAACSKKSEDVNPDKIDAFYTLSYDAKTNVTTSKASFGYRQRTVRLTEGAYLHIDGFMPNFNSSQKAYIETYSYLKPSVIFAYFDNNSRTYYNDITLIPIDYPHLFQLASTTIDLPFYWVGDPLEVNEIIQLKIASEAAPDSTVTFTASAQGSRFIYISAAALRSKVPIGQGIATLVRTRRSPLQQSAPAGGLRTSIYTCTRNILIN